MLSRTTTTTTKRVKTKQKDYNNGKANSYINELLVWFGLVSIAQGIKPALY